MLATSIYPISRYDFNGLLPQGLRAFSAQICIFILYLFPDSLCIIIHFSANPTTIQARILCLFAQVCKRKNPISKTCLDLAVISLRHHVMNTIHFQLILNNEFNCISYAILPK